MSHIVAIASGKGGVGKTWLAISLSHALARRGRRVLLFDGDLGLANVDVQLGLGPGPDLAGALVGRGALAQAVRAVEACGFDVLPGRSGSGQLARIDGAVLDRMLAEQEAARSRDRRAMVGTGDRSAKIRTYNFPQNRVTYHRINLSLHQLDDVLEGELDPLVEALRRQSREERAGDA